MLELEEKLRESELKLAIATGKLAIFDDKIEDKNDIIEALKMSNSLYKSICKNLEEELSTLSQGKIKPSQELETNTNNSAVAKLRGTISILKESVKEKKLVIASLEAQIKGNARDEKYNLQIIKTLNSQIGEKEEELKNEKDVIASLEAQIKEKDSKNVENEHMMNALGVQIVRITSEQKEHKAHIASLKNQIGQKNESLKKNKDLISSLKAQIEKKDKINCENIKLITNLKVQIKNKDDQTALLTLDLNLETCKSREKDELLKNQAATILKLKTYQEKLEENQKRIPSESESDQQISKAS
ncbi:kinesin-like protein KIN-12E [Drosophila erecta]|uniref:kinesin-like protein KIN-12E n=1 Tax=Drosophila erecta TaxID=7220 RepID=UPI0001780016|nr:kinesin-like protein KIN-12E [Drosophila erecta]